MCLLEYLMRHMTSKSHNKMTKEPKCLFCRYFHFACIQNITIFLDNHKIKPHLFLWQNVYHERNLLGWWTIPFKMCFAKLNIVYNLYIFSMPVMTYSDKMTHRWLNKYNRYNEEIFWKSNYFQKILFFDKLQFKLELTGYNHNITHYKFNNIFVL